LNSFIYLFIYLKILAGSCSWTWGDQAKQLADRFATSTSLQAIGDFRATRFVAGLGDVAGAPG